MGNIGFEGISVCYQKMPNDWLIGVCLGDGMVGGGKQCERKEEAIADVGLFVLFPLCLNNQVEIWLCLRKRV